MSLLPLAAALLVAPNTATPEGPATLRVTWLGAVPSIAYGPRVVVRWRVVVGDGSAAGPVALRVISNNPTRGPGIARGTGPVEQLPATPGVHEFAARLRFREGDALGMDQQAGRHAIIATDVYDEDAVDVWRPPLGPDETRLHEERIGHARLLISPVFEGDADADGYGDRTQDENDLDIAASPGRRAVRVTLRNRGDRPVHLPHVLVRMHHARLLNRSQVTWLRTERGYRRVKLRKIEPRAKRTVFIRASRPGFRVKLVAGSEGFDPTRASVVVRGR